MSLTADERTTLLQTLKFLRDSLEDALAKPEDRIALIDDARGAVSVVVRNLLTHDDFIQTQAMLLADEQITGNNWRDWWTKLSTKSDEEFASDIDAFLKIVDLLNAIVSRPEGSVPTGEN